MVIYSVSARHLGKRLEDKTTAPKDTSISPPKKLLYMVILFNCTEAALVRTKDMRIPLLRHK